MPAASIRFKARSGSPTARGDQLAAALPGVARPSMTSRISTRIGRRCMTMARREAIRRACREWRRPRPACRSGPRWQMRRPGICPIWRTSVNVPSGKEHQGLAGGGELQHATRIDAALVAVEAFDELRSQAPQQQAGERHPHHFFLDHEGKIGRQRRGCDQTVDVARMIGDHHAGDLRQPVQSLDGERDAGSAQEGARERSGHQAPAAAGSAGTD